MNPKKLMEKIGLCMFIIGAIIAYTFKPEEFTIEGILGLISCMGGFIIYAANNP